MKNLFSVSAAGAMALGAVAAHASIAAPSSNSSDVVLFAEVINTAAQTAVASYAGDTGLTVTQFENLSSTPVTKLSGDQNLVNLFAADGTGDTIVWGLIGGQWNGSVTPTKGNVQLITTTTTNAAPPTTLTGTKLTGMTNAYAAGITSLNTNLGTASSIEGSNPASSGVWDQTSATGGLAFWGTALANAVNAGTTANLFYVTGGGSSFAALGSTAEGTASLTAGGVTLAGIGGTSPPPVPLPPAVWLFGSGLLGLAGVARRKAKA
jgi:hypothetical protein